MELPDLVRESLGDEDVVAGLRLGDEDLVVFTPTRTVLYRGEGLLSDEGLTEYPFDFERLQADWGRRKVTFTLHYIDDERDFSVPKKRGERVLERLIEGSLRVAEVIEPDEAVTGVYRFSELTLVVTEGRLLKHVGGYTWDGDFESFDYADLTRLDFEEGSVATQVVLGTGTGRTERIKAPNQEAGTVRKALQQSVFTYYDVDSLEALNRKIEPDEVAEETSADAGLGLDAGIDPLVQSGEENQEGAAPDRVTSGQATATADQSGDSSQEPTGSSSTDEPATSASGASSDPGESVAALDSRIESATGDADDDLDAVAEHLEDLTAAVERQNELLYRHQQTVQKLIQELKQGR